jgi:hypothetical protein
VASLVLRGSHLAKYVMSCSAAATSASNGSGAFSISRCVGLHSLPGVRFAGYMEHTGCWLS